MSAVYRASALALCVVLAGGCGASVEGPGSGDAEAWADATREDGRVVRGPYATRVVSFTPGEGATFGHDQLPDIVLGPPMGGGRYRGGTDVVSLGRGGVIVVALEDRVITDGPGVDFLVFENAFEVQGSNPARYWDELGEVSVSEDGERWVTFPCAPGARPYAHCAGWHAVYARGEEGGSAWDPATVGGDPFDLAVVGLSRARYIRIRDLATQDLQPPSSGFDLDAVAVVHGAPVR